MGAFGRRRRDELADVVRDTVDLVDARAPAARWGAASAAPAAGAPRALRGPAGRAPAAALEPAGLGMRAEIAGLFGDRATLRRFGAAGATASLSSASAALPCDSLSEGSRLIATRAPTGRERVTARRGVFGGSLRGAVEDDATDVTGVSFSGSSGRGRLRPTTLDESDGASEVARESVRKVGACRTVLSPVMSLNARVASLAEPEEAIVASVAIDTSRDSAAGKCGEVVAVLFCGAGGRTRRLYGVRRVLSNESSSSYIESSGSSISMLSSSL